VHSNIAPKQCFQWLSESDRYALRTKRLCRCFATSFNDTFVKSHIYSASDSTFFDPSALRIGYCVALSYMAISLLLVLMCRTSVYDGHLSMLFKFNSSTRSTATHWYVIDELVSESEVYAQSQWKPPCCFLFAVCFSCMFTAINCYKPTSPPYLSSTSNSANAEKPRDAWLMRLFFSSIRLPGIGSMGFSFFSQSMRVTDH